MKKVLALILILAAAVSLFSCTDKSDLPEGMQLVRGGEKYGYYMYAPEEWVVSNHGDISAAYASAVDSSTVSYVEFPEPKISVSEYFKASLSEFPSAPTMVEENKAVTFGNADSAVMFVFDHTYAEHAFRTMQIFAKYGDRFGLLTFTSPMENISSPELKQYEYYNEKRDAIVNNFKFVAKSGEEEKPEYEKDSDGYKLISDKSIAKFSLWVPDTFSVKSTSGIVEAYLEDGSNITMSRATTTGVAVNQYWNIRKTELEAIFGTVTQIGEAKPTSLGEAKQAFAYEYTFRYAGETYHVYQIYAVTFLDGFVFTYTAKELNYNTHFETIQKIIDKVTY